MISVPEAEGTEPCSDRPDLFYGPDGERAHEKPYREARAAQLCAGCRLVDKCAVWGILHERYGVWGGLTESQRARVRADRGIVLDLPETWWQTVVAVKGSSHVA